MSCFSLFFWLIRVVIVVQFSVLGGRKYLIFGSVHYISLDGDDGPPAGLNIAPVKTDLKTHGGLDFAGFFPEVLIRSLRSKLRGLEQGALDADKEAIGWQRLVAWLLRPQGDTPRPVLSLPVHSDAPVRFGLVRM